MRVYIYLPLWDFEDTSVTKNNDMLHGRHYYKECGDSRSLFFGSCFLLMPYIAGSLRNNHQQSLFDLWSNLRVFHRFTLTSIVVVHSGRLFADDHSTLDRSDSTRTEHAFGPVRNSQNLA
jgi:hypothetical protein